MADPRHTAAAVKDAIGVLGGGFMMSREAKALCEQNGLGGREMYFRGRCGVLGEVDADVVTAACVFFPAGHVRESWEGGRSLPADKAADMYASACHAWGRRRLGGFDGCARLAGLLEPVIAEASVLGAPLFAGWRALPPPPDAPARAAHMLHVARELRGGVHGMAVLSLGLSPLEATLVGTHFGSPTGLADGVAMARFLQWPEPYPEPSARAVELRARAEELTDELLAPAFAVLDDAQAGELIELLGRARGL
ncbi:hypothetical protein HNP84_002833 [Thermocatellispora tengchongensis]|uniref:EvbL n=1 Tax=Thermocatellispora tengchongensis TaxID=1073253 RepID=A0A840P155_9ACTN|nr:hypothetical protein [Thermocatellispora tengchongensis]MBB5133112.1 hypothetical protein [Thermocatellispora tengchongensis]